MKEEKRQRTTVTVRLTDEEYEVLERLCALKKTSRTAYLARLATSHAKQELLTYATGAYLEGKASLSELAKKRVWTCQPLWMRWRGSPGRIHGLWMVFCLQ
jgi:hypothetical protein